MYHIYSDNARAYITNYGACLIAYCIAIVDVRNPVKSDDILINLEELELVAGSGL